MERQILRITQITLHWSDWTRWTELKVDGRKNGAVKVPKERGVYEVRYPDENERLTIGRAASLRQRIKAGLVKGIAPHSAGKKIRKLRGLSRIEVRWAVTDRPACAEEELHRKYRSKFGSLPKYVEHT